MLSDEDENEDDEVDAEAMKFDLDADLANVHLVTTSPTRVSFASPSHSSRSIPGPTPSLSICFIALEQTVLAMQEDQWKFFEDMRTLITSRLPPPS